MNNITEVKYSSDIISILKRSKQRFVIVAVTLKDTPNYLKVQLRRWLKTYSKHYPNIMFVYFCADRSDLGSMGVIPEDTSLYPCMWHIVDMKDIAGKIYNANAESATDLFNDKSLKPYYIKDLERYMLGDDEDDEIPVKKTKKKGKSSKSNKSSTGDDEISNDECDNVETDHDSKSNANMINMNKQKGEVDMVTKQKEMFRKKQLEKMKLLEKLKIMNASSEKFINKFMKDIKKRKRLEDD